MPWLGVLEPDRTAARRPRRRRGWSVQVSPPSLVCSTVPPWPTAQPRFGVDEGHRRQHAARRDRLRLPPGLARVVGEQDHAVVADRDEPRSGARDGEQGRLGRQPGLEGGRRAVAGGCAAAPTHRAPPRAHDGDERQATMRRAAIIRAPWRRWPRGRLRANACARAASHSASPTRSCRDQAAHQRFLEPRELAVGVDDLPQETRRCRPVPSS